MTRFRKLGLLGSGSYGKVHLAGLSDDHNSILPTSLTAVKSADICSPSFTFLLREKMFLEELVGSPFVIQGFGDDVSNEKGKTTYNVMMEYADGGTLKGLIGQRGGRIGEAEAACYTAMLLDGLSCIHEKGIVHCDMKPDNVLFFPMIERQGVLNYHLLKIADFGLAKKEWEEDMVCKPGLVNRNRGALLYASPESILFGKHTPGHDVWALGCIVFEMLTGRPVWKSEEKEDLISEVMFAKPDKSEFVSEIARDFVQKCLEKQPRDRWTTKRLRRHPFISNNARHFRMTDHLARSMNPFGLDVGQRMGTFSDFPVENTRPRQHCYPYSWGLCQKCGHIDF